MAARNDAPSLLSIAGTLGEIKATQTHMLDQLSRGATKEHVSAVERDVDKLATLIRDNHIGHDSRLRALETTQSSLTTEQNSTSSFLGRVADAVFKMVVALAIVGLGAKQTGVL